jgi:hypothetical protein
MYFPPRLLFAYHRLSSVTTNKVTTSYVERNIIFLVYNSAGMFLSQPLLLRYYSREQNNTSFRYDELICICQWQCVLRISYLYCACNTRRLVGVWFLRLEENIFFFMWDKFSTIVNIPKNTVHSLHLYPCPVQLTCCSALRFHITT